MAARFTKGDSISTTKETRAHGKAAEPTKPGGRSASGMPHYIKTGTGTKGAERLRGTGGPGPVMNPREIPIRKGPARPPSGGTTPSLKPKHMGSSSGRKGGTMEQLAGKVKFGDITGRKKRLMY